jgi:hypothetical protein
MKQIFNMILFKNYKSIAPLSTLGSLSRLSEFLS